MNFCRRFKILTVIVFSICLIAASYNLTREIQINRCRASGAAWFQEIEQVSNLVSKNHYMPTIAAEPTPNFSSETIYRDTHIPTGPPAVNYKVGGDTGETTNFGLAKPDAD